MQKLFLADFVVAVFVNFLENFTDFLLTAFFIFQKGRYLIVGYHPRVIDIEVGESLLEMLHSQGFRFQSGNDELGEVDFSRPICVYNPH